MKWHNLCLYFVIGKHGNPSFQKALITKYVPSNYMVNYDVLLSNGHREVSKYRET